jgi:hypothetical protein
MVLLLHWSMLNYAAVVKILKKHGAAAVASFSLQGVCTSVCTPPDVSSLVCLQPRGCDADKRSDVLLRTPFLANVLKQVRRCAEAAVARRACWRCASQLRAGLLRQTARPLALQPLRHGALTWSAAAQPFYSTEHITELVRDAEQRIEALRQGDAGVTTLGTAATAAKVERLRETEALLFRRARRPPPARSRRSRSAQGAL